YNLGGQLKETPKEVQFRSGKAPQGEAVGYYRILYEIAWVWAKVAVALSVFPAMGESVTLDQLTRQVLSPSEYRSFRRYVPYRSEVTVDYADRGLDALGEFVPWKKAYTLTGGMAQLSRSM